jgi:hypothetical protein
MLLRIKQEALRRTKLVFAFDTTWTEYKTTPPTIVRCRGHFFTELLLSNDTGIHRRTHRLSFDKTRTTQKMTRLIILLLLHVFVAEGKCLPSRCLATIGGIHIVTDGRDL